MDATVLVSAVGVVVALIGTSYSIYVGRRTSALSAESVRLAGEQEAVRRAVQTDVIDRLLAIYEALHDFHDYIWLVWMNREPIDAAFVHDFYMARFAELTAIRTSPAYAQFRHVLRSMGETPTVTAADLHDARGNASVMSSVEKHFEVFEGAPIRDVFSEFEASFWRNLLHSAEKIHRAVSSPKAGVPDPERPEWLKELDEKDARGSEAVMKSSLFEMQRLEVYLFLLRNYAPTLAVELSRRFGGPTRSGVSAVPARSADATTNVEQ